MNIGILGAGNITGSMARTICGMAAQGRPVTLYAVHRGRRRRRMRSPRRMASRARTAAMRQC